jgi:RHS repeat-associated protein
VTLYGKGEAVGMNYYDTESYGGGRKYLGKDVMGSVWGVTDDYGILGGEYDVFGEVYEGDLGGGMKLGYTGKPYDVVTGMYNYGYRDYKAEVARFTTEDPIRDENNWYAYVNNDPVNWVDLWGLEGKPTVRNELNWEDMIDVPGITVYAYETSEKDQLNSTMNEKFVSEAMKMLGDNTYVWAGKNPTIDGGTDCSGTVEWAAEQASKVAIRTRNANEQARDPKLTVPGDNSRGTLNFYDYQGDGRYDHVTINPGDGTEINPFGNDTNKRGNPGAIKIMPQYILKESESMINRQLNWSYILE